ncbi:MAG: acyl-CoA carboxylase subunit epsilon [Micrococcales bacterium]|nr:acyl-CoA carboxylase subunit epsilon [Micrococcales bacterium]
MSEATMSETTTDAVPAEAAPADEAPKAPAIEIIGDATPEQVAALVTVLSALGGGEDDGKPRRSAWSDPGTAHGFYVRRNRPSWRSWRG